MYTLVVLSDEVLILRGCDELYSLQRRDLDYALELYRNLVTGGGES